MPAFAAVSRGAVLRRQAASVAGQKGYTCGSDRTPRGYGASRLRKSSVKTVEFDGARQVNGTPLHIPGKRNSASYPCISVLGRKGFAIVTARRGCSF